MSVDASSKSARALARDHLPRAEEFLRWPPGLQAYGYRIVDKLFASRVVAGPAGHWPKYSVRNPRCWSGV